jgi:hypothetical protein
MDVKHRLGDQESDTSRVNREGPEGRHARDEIVQASPRFDGDEEEGQLGPDELSDPDEVAMNHEAKMHR